MHETDVNIGVSKPAEMTPEQWAIAALKTAEQEIRRLQRLGYVPYTLNDDDLRSEANEILAGMVGSPEDHVRRHVRFGLTNCITREFMKQRQEVPSELLQKHTTACIGALEFHQLTADLTEKQRQAVVLFYISGETAESASEMLGISERAFFLRIEGALESIRKIFFADLHEMPC